MRRIDWQVVRRDLLLGFIAWTHIHRSTIVNLDRVMEVRPWFVGDYLVKLHDGGELRLSRRYRDRLP